MGPREKRRRRLARAAKISAAALVVLVLLNLFVVERGRVKLHSMEPTLSDGDWVLFEKVTKRCGGPRRFDVLVFKAPNDPDKAYIKRLIGLPDEVVEADDGRLLVNGEEVAVPAGKRWAGMSFGPTAVGPAHYFVVGDNPDESRDSRDWGGVPRDYILGRVFLRWWPPAEMACIRRESASTEGVESGD